jgi:hypothetical protein
LRFLASSFQGVATRHEGSSEYNHEETKKTKKEQKKGFALFVSSWLIFILSARRSAT